ncbi:MAG: hypothetical protein H0U06_09840 [Solirubrobacterales bacterium]|nr:hypothetical protein [Solirubrobacterales bacterium]
MSHDDAGRRPPEQDVPPVPAIDEDSIPARRLLAHDVEHSIWDHDGDDGAPPPD